MFTIDPDNTTIGFGLEKAISQTDVINAIATVQNLLPGKDVIPGDSFVENADIYANARLFVDVYPRSAGYFTQCTVGKVGLYKEIPDLKHFLSSLAHILNTKLYMDKTSNSGFLFYPDGNVEERKFYTEFIEGKECLFVE